MRKLTFFNNASFRLAEALTNTYGVQLILPDRQLSAANMPLPEVAEGLYTIATITHPSLPGANEVIFLIGPVEVAGVTYVMAERAREQTDAVAWPADSLVECRVTQGMLASLGAGSIYSYDSAAIAQAGGDAFADFTARGDFVMLKDAYAVGGAPVGPARGHGEYVPLATSVEGVGYSCVVELGVAPDYNPAKTYYPGDYAKDTASPFTTWAYQRGNAFPEAASALGAAPWVQYAPASNANVVAEHRLNNADYWFYPTEIGFICEDYSATSSPTIVVKELDASGSTVGDLIASQALTGIGTRKRFVLSSSLTNGVNGLSFVLSTAAAGGTCRGRFYWKGLFICSNSAAGFLQEIGETDGRFLTGIPA